MGIAGIAFVLRREPWPAGATVVAAATAAVAAWALVVSQTRNAWLGAVFGLAAVLVLRAPRTLWLLAAAVAALLLARPASIAQRLTFSDASSVDRYYMWQAGFDMIRDKPIMGQGPGMILRVYPKYRWPEAPNPQQPHLHDNPLQIAAERGLPGPRLLGVDDGRAPRRRAARGPHGPRAPPRSSGPRPSAPSSRCSWPASSSTTSATPKC